ncbi:MAG: hypothetical protein AAF221_04155 [Pseudomonadota bacterium]
MNLTIERRQEIEGVIREVLKKKLSGVSINAVDIAPDFDEFGDPILRVKVIYKDQGKTPLQGLSGLVRNIRPSLSRMQEERFPVMSFIASSEMEALKSEAH